MCCIYNEALTNLLRNDLAKAPRKLWKVVSKDGSAILALGVWRKIEYDEYHYRPGVNLARRCVGKQYLPVSIDTKYINDRPCGIHVFLNRVDAQSSAYRFGGVAVQVKVHAEDLMLAGYGEGYDSKVEAVFTKIEIDKNDWEEAGLPPRVESFDLNGYKGIMSCE